MTSFSEILFPSATVTADTYTNSVINVPPLTHGHIIVDVSVATSGSITPSIQGYNPASDSWYTILTGAAISTVSTVVLKVGPAFTAAANVAVADMLPSKWRVFLDAAAGASVVASVGINLAP
jgi:hypothetical protein